MDSMKSFIISNFHVDLESKSESEKQYFITGYISTTDLDRVNDIVTSDCLSDMLSQLKGKNIKLDIEHEVLKGNKVPVGKIIDGGIDQKGLWVKALLNDALPDFEATWKSLKNGFLDAFSILYKPIKYFEKNLNGKTVRLLNKIDLINVALTGNPVNPNCIITTAFKKSLDALIECEIMDSEKEKKELDAKKTNEKAMEKEDHKEPDGDEKEMKEECPAGEKCPYKKKLEEEEKAKVTKSISNLEAELKSYKSEIAELKSLVGKSPIFKSQIEQKTVTSENREMKKSFSPLDLI